MDMHRTTRPVYLCIYESVVMQCFKILSIVGGQVHA